MKIEVIEVLRVPYNKYNVVVDGKTIHCMDRHPDEYGIRDALEALCFYMNDTKRIAGSASGRSKKTTMRTS